MCARDTRHTYYSNIDNHQFTILAEITFYTVLGLPGILHGYSIPFNRGSLNGDDFVVKKVSKYVRM